MVRFADEKHGLFVFQDQRDSGLEKAKKATEKIGNKNLFILNKYYMNMMNRTKAFFNYFLLFNILIIYLILQTSWCLLKRSIAACAIRCSVRRKYHMKKSDRASSNRN